MDNELSADLIKVAQSLRTLYGSVEKLWSNINQMLDREEKLMDTIDSLRSRLKVVEDSLSRTRRQMGE